MKLLTFLKKNTEQSCLGALVDNKVLDLSNLSSNMLDFINGGQKMLDAAIDILKKPINSNLYNLDQIQIKAPILNPPSLKDFFAFEEHAKAGAKRRNE